MFSKLMLPKRRFWTSEQSVCVCVCVFEVLFKDVSTRFGRPLIENSFKNAHATFGSTLENSSFGEHKTGKRSPHSFDDSCPSLSCGRCATIVVSIDLTRDRMRLSSAQWSENSQWRRAT
jgi:hypothetical protein